jgi:TPR repeat protein
MNLAFLYKEGIGVPQDYKEAVKWYHVAAEQGDAHAQNNLGAMFSKGRGVEKNYVKATFWFEQAAHNGFERAQISLRRMKRKMGGNLTLKRQNSLL